MLMTYLIHDGQIRAETNAETIANLLRKGWVETDAPPAPEPPPLVVSMRSLQLALVDASLYQTVTTLINGIPDATDKLKTQIYWTKSATVDRQHPVVLGLVAALVANGIAMGTVDAVFAAARTMDASTH